MCLAKRERTRQTCCSLSKMKTIFISIAAYKDPQLVATMQSALDNAIYPENLHFGVALQYDEEPDLSSFENVSTISYNPEQRPGIVRVRHNISKLYSGQDFYLQIDSHYQFAFGWDKYLLDGYEKISEEQNTHKIMILPLEPYTDGIMTSRFTLALEDRPFGKIAHPHPVNDKTLEDCGAYHEITFARVGQIFFPGSYLSEVGFDPFSQVSLEIPYFSYRTIMSGYKVFQLNEKVLWQSDAEYYSAVWEGREAEETYRDPNRFKSDAVFEGMSTWNEMSLAFVYNDFSKYAIKDAVMSAEDFWKMQGAHQEYLDAKKYFDLALYNNL